MNPLPTISQIREVKRLHSSRLFGPATIARLTGASLRDVFRIQKTMLHGCPVSDSASPFDLSWSGGDLPSFVTVVDGIVVDGQHRLVASRS